MLRPALYSLLVLAGCTGGDGDPQIDAAPQVDADPQCSQVDSRGGFPDCTVCEAGGNGCDTVDVNGQSSRFCDCSASCPCGLRCGQIEIGPGVVVSDICVR
jgi:hypothetical protein